MGAYLGGYKSVDSYSRKNRSGQSEPEIYQFSIVSKAQCSSLGLVLKLTLLSQPVTMESNSKHDLVTSISCASGTIYIFLCSDLQL